jgi:pyruvate dehydrogenase E1 component alpha subunit
MAVRSLIGLAELFGVPASSVDGADAGAVRSAMTRAILRARRGKGPTFIEARIVRWPGSRSLRPRPVTGATDVAMAWEPSRIPVEHLEWFTAGDGLIRYIRELIDAKAADRSSVAVLDEAVRNEILHAVETALDAPYPSRTAALADAFVPN